MLLRNVMPKYGKTVTVAFAIAGAAVLAVAAIEPAWPAQTLQRHPSRVVHNFSSSMTIIEDGDTVTWIYSRPGGADKPARTDTSVFVFRADSSVIQLRPFGPRKVSAKFAKVIAHTLTEAKAQEALEAKMGSLHSR